MTDILYILYPWAKTLHIISVISWMAGIFYLPRLFVRHSESVSIGTETDFLFQDMEKKLFKIIMTPAFKATWLFGLILAFTPGVIDWGSGWPWVKLLCVILMTVFHFWCDRRRKDFELGQNIKSGRHFRIMNEVPTLLMIIIVGMVVIRPF